MLAVIDSSVAVRAVIRPECPSGQVIVALAAGRFATVFSATLLDEPESVLHRDRIRLRYRLREEQIKELLSLVTAAGELLVPGKPVTACRDPKDNMVLEAAIAGRADVIVTADNDLLDMGGFEGIPIVDPARFLEMLDDEASLRA